MLLWDYYTEIKAYPSSLSSTSSDTSYSEAASPKMPGTKIDGHALTSLDRSLRRRLSLSGRLHVTPSGMKLYSWPISSTSAKSILRGRYFPAYPKIAFPSWPRELRPPGLTFFGCYVANTCALFGHGSESKGSWLQV